MTYGPNVLKISRIFAMTGGGGGHMSGKHICWRVLKTSGLHRYIQQKNIDILIKNAITTNKMMWTKFVVFSTGRDDNSCTMKLMMMMMDTDKCRTVSTEFSEHLRNNECWKVGGEDFHSWFSQFSFSKMMRGSNFHFFSQSNFSFSPFLHKWHTYIPYLFNSIYIFKINQTPGIGITDSTVQNSKDAMFIGSINASGLTSFFTWKCVSVLFSDGIS